jgi:hypothetical protein
MNPPSLDPTTPHNNFAEYNQEAPQDNSTLSTQAHRQSLKPTPKPEPGPASQGDTNADSVPLEKYSNLKRRFSSLREVSSIIIARSTSAQSPAGNTRTSSWKLSPTNASKSTALYPGSFAKSCNTCLPPNSTLLKSRTRSSLQFSYPRAQI